MDAETGKGGAAAAEQSEIAAGADVATEESEESLARGLADEMAREGKPEGAESNEENANAGDESPGAEGAEAEAEADSEAVTEEVLSQEQSGEAGEANANGENPEAEAESEEAELQKRIGKIPKLTPEQGQHVSEIIKERVGKVTRKLRETEERVSAAETRASTAEQRVQELEANGVPPAAPAGTGALDNITTLEALEQKAQSSQQVVDFCDDMLVLVRRNPQQVERRLRGLNVKLANEAGEEDYTPEAMQAWLDETRLASHRRLTREIPARAQFLKVEKAASAQAEQVAPWLKNPKDPRVAKLNELVRTNPAVKSFPAWRLLLARAVDHAHQEQLAAGKAQAKPAPAKQPVAKAKPVVPNTPVKTGKAAPARNGNAKSAELIAAEKAYQETGSQKDLERVLTLEG